MSIRYCVIEKKNTNRILPFFFLFSVIFPFTKGKGLLRKQIKVLHGGDGLCSGIFTFKRNHLQGLETGKYSSGCGRFIFLSFWPKIQEGPNYGKSLKNSKIFFQISISHEFKTKYRVIFVFFVKKLGRKGYRVLSIK